MYNKNCQVESSIRGILFKRTRKHQICRLVSGNFFQACYYGITLVSEHDYYLIFVNSSMFSKVPENIKHFALRIPEMDAECLYMHRRLHIFSRKTETYQHITSSINT